MFRELRGHRAVLFCFISGALFLPEQTIRFGGLPDYSKAAAICYGVFLAALLLDTRGLISIRFRWFDIPIVVFCLVPIPSAMANDLPVMDGVNIAFSLIFSWGMPYFLGRCFLKFVRRTAFRRRRCLHWRPGLHAILFVRDSNESVPKQLGLWIPVQSVECESDGRLST